MAWLLLRGAEGSEEGLRSLVFTRFASRCERKQLVKSSIEVARQKAGHKHACRYLAVATFIYWSEYSSALSKGLSSRTARPSSPHRGLSEIHRLNKKQAAQEMPKLPTNQFKTPRVRFELTTNRLTVDRSTAELPRIALLSLAVTLP